MNRPGITFAAALLLVWAGCSPADEAAPPPEPAGSTASETTATATTGSSWTSPAIRAQERARAAAEEASRRAAEADAVQADQ